MEQPSSETTLVNQALVRIGQLPLSDLYGDTTPQAIAARTLFFDMRDTLLRRLKWNFARRFTALSMLPVAPLNVALLPDPDYVGQVIYTQAYFLPIDYIRLSDVSPFSAHWRIVGKFIYTDAGPQVTLPPLVGLQPPNADGSDNVPTVSPSSQATATNGIEYIRQVTDPNEMDPLFKRVLTLDLAMALCQTSTGLGDLRKMLLQEREADFMEARFVNGAEQWPEQLYDNVMVDVRMGYSSGAGTGNAMLN